MHHKRSRAGENVLSPVEEATHHPNWSMGKKITVDSATLMNKGLEVIEARWLFDFEPERIQVVVHPQSVIHSMVQYADGVVIAQMGAPDMRNTIAYSLGFPERLDAGVEPLNFSKIKTLTFEPRLSQFSGFFIRFQNLFQAGRSCFDRLERGQRDRRRGVYSRQDRLYRHCTPVSCNDVRLPAPDSDQLGRDFENG